MQPANGCTVFSLSALSGLFSGRRNKGVVTSPDGASGSGTHSVEFVCLTKFSSEGEAAQGGNMSVTPAAKGPPLPPRSSTLPPLPPNRRVSAPAPYQLNPPPPPPRRNASLPSADDLISEFEARFRFHPVSSLPPPEPFSDGKRTYPSQMQKATPRRPAERQQIQPPPPSLPPPLPPPR